MSSTTVDLKPEKVHPYLKYITGAIIYDSHNKGSLRKNIWLYLMKKHGNDVDYQEFLVAIRKFMNDGKMFNNEGEFSMHPEVIKEFQSKTTPVKTKASIVEDKIINSVHPSKLPAFS